MPIRDTRKTIHRISGPAWFAVAFAFAACAPKSPSPRHDAPGPTSLVPVTTAPGVPSAESTLTRLLQAFVWQAVPPSQPILDRRLIAKAEPDECFEQIGYPSSAPPCAADHKPKVNQAYMATSRSTRAASSPPAGPASRRERPSAR